MVKLSLLVGALLTSTATAFAPPGTASSKTSTQVSAAHTLPGAEVDGVGNNVAVKNLLEKVESSRLLTKVAQSGLLSSAQEAGVSLSKLEPILEYANENPDILILVEASGPELLPILPKLVELAPPALPLLAAAVKVPPAALQVAALACFGGAFLVTDIIPDDTVLEVATQTLAVGALGAAGVASIVGAGVLGKLTN